METVQVSRDIFPKANNPTTQIHLIQSKQTGLWYIAASELSLLIGINKKKLRDNKFSYRWKSKVDGKCLSDPQINNRKLHKYFSIDDAKILFFNAEQAAVFQEYLLPPPAAAQKKRMREKEREVQETHVFKRPAVEVPPPPAATARYEKIVRDWFAKNEHVLREQAIQRLMKMEQVRQAAKDLIVNKTWTWFYFLQKYGFHSVCQSPTL